MKNQSSQRATLARNTIFNLAGQMLPLCIGFLAMPYVIDGLGRERFGLLGLVWAILGYFGLFNFGLGRATTKFMAEYLAQGRVRELSESIWTAVVLQVALGLIGFGMFVLAIPHLVTNILIISTPLIAEAQVTLTYLAVGIPIFMFNAALRGVLEGGQRFDILNIVRIPTNSLVFLAPVLAVMFGFGLPMVLVILVTSRFLAALTYLGFCLKLFPFLRSSFSFHAGRVLPLMRYGGWVSVSTIIGPLLVNMDRFLIGALISVSAVTYYIAPFEMLTRLSVFPGSLVAALFPAFSEANARGLNQSFQRYYEGAVKVIFLFMGVIALILFCMADEFLTLWLGADFAHRSATTVQILALGLFLNSLAFVPFTFLQGVGRPDLTAKFHLIELPIHIFLMWVLINILGIYGAALAWTLRIGLDAVLLFGASWRLYEMKVFNLKNKLELKNLLPWIALLIGLVAGSIVDMTRSTRIASVITIVTVYCWIVWSFALSEIEKRTVATAWGQLLTKARRVRVG